MKTRDYWHSDYTRPAWHRRFQTVYPVDDPEHLARALHEAEFRPILRVDSLEGRHYTPYHENLFYTTRSLLSPTTGVRLPFETPVFVAWSDNHRITDVGVELEDDCIEARFVRDSQDTPGWHHPADAVTVAAQGLSMILRAEYNTSLIHEALDEEVVKARELEKLDQAERTKHLTQSPIVSWLGQRGVRSEPHQSAWDGDYYEPHHWDHFRRPHVEPK